MTHNSKKRTVGFVFFGPLYKRNTPVSDEICEVVLCIIHPVPFFVRVVSYRVVVEFGVQQQSFPFVPTHWHPAPIVLIQILAKITWERSKDHYYHDLNCFLKFF